MGSWKQIAQFVLIGSTRLKKLWVRGYRDMLFLQPIATVHGLQLLNRANRSYMSKMETIKRPVNQPAKIQASVVRVEMRFTSLLRHHNRCSDHRRNLIARDEIKISLSRNESHVPLSYACSAMRSS